MIPQLLLCILTYLSTHFFSSHMLFILLPGKEVKYSLFLQKSFSCNWAAIPNELILHRTLVLQFCHRADAGTNEIISRNFCTLENSKRMVLFPVALYLNLIIFLIFYIKRQPQVSVCQSFTIEDRSRQPRQQKLSQVLEARSSSAWCQQSQALQRGIYFFYYHSQAVGSDHSVFLEAVPPPKHLDMSLSPRKDKTRTGDCIFDRMFPILSGSSIFFI